MATPHRPRERGASPRPFRDARVPARGTGAAVLHYWRGGIPNPWLSERIVPVPLGRADVDALVAFLEALDGEGYADEAPAAFPP